ncbi:MAG: hypothetical protein HY826_06965 [Actinobacteria bacterium]|nr:hypothetical protein [Actinomycetota bacterium]
MRDQLRDAITELAPQGVRCGVLAIDAGHIVDLAPEELELIATAGDRRTAEFATGRALLHQLLGDTNPITRTAHGSPNWPKGVVGSLSHDRQHVLAVVGDAGQYRALGIDIESEHESDEELRASVVRSDDPLIDAAAAFVMKEAAYKAWSDCGGALIDHLAVHLCLDDNNFIAEMPTPKMKVRGGFTKACGSWIAVAAILTSLSPNDHDSLTPRF